MAEKCPVCGKKTYEFFRGAMTNFKFLPVSQPALIAVFFGAKMMSWKKRKEQEDIKMKF